MYIYVTISDFSRSVFLRLDILLQDIITSFILSLLALLRDTEILSSESWSHPSEMTRRNNVTKSESLKYACFLRPSI
jgi:hypothetical protein